MLFQILPQTPIELSLNTLKTSLNHPKNFLQTPLKHPWNTLEIPLKLPWNPIWKYLNSLKYPWNTHSIFLEIFSKLPWNFLETLLIVPWSIARTSQNTSTAFFKHHKNSLRLRNIHGFLQTDNENTQFFKVISWSYWDRYVSPYPLLVY